LGSSRTSDGRSRAPRVILCSAKLAPGEVTAAACWSAGIPRRRAAKPGCRAWVAA